jgi:NAD(P)-dependent dehydrogenase (short-subunit alcohol dehydrogenase family)
LERHIMTNNLNGSAALVTGATSGIGEAAAVKLAGQGALVIVHGRNTGRGAAVVKEIQAAGGQARFLAADLSDPDSVRRLAQDAGDIDILVNNAGVYQFGSTAEVDDATFSLHIDTNLRAPFLLVKHLAPGMAARGGGAIVNVSTFGNAFALGRTADAREIAEAVVFLASPAASYVNGAVLQVHGGLKAVMPG